MSTHFTDVYSNLSDQHKVELLATELQKLFVNAELNTNKSNADFLIANSSIHYITKLSYLLKN